MAQTFDIRFARSAGLAALLEAPENRFRWKGGGLLRIDAQSISFTVKRGLSALFAGKRTRRIPAGNLKAVYREGDALRVEFQTDETARVVLPFWAVDRDAAAQIVRLLPTSRTVEIEHATRSARPRPDWRNLLLLGAVFATFVIAGLVVYQRTLLSTAHSPVLDDGVALDTQVRAPTAGTSSTPVETTAPSSSSTMRAEQRVEAPAFPLDGAGQKLVTKPGTREPLGMSASSANPGSPPRADSTPSAAAGSDVSSPTSWHVAVTPEGVVPIVPGMPAYEAARRQLDLFLAESSTLRRYYVEVRYESNDQRFEKIETLWWKVTVRVSNSPSFEDPVLRPLQEIELAISRAWRRAFAMYPDPALLASADAEVEFAEMLEARARQLVN